MNPRLRALVPLTALVLAGCSTSTSARSSAAQQPPTSPAVGAASPSTSTASTATPAQTFAPGDCDHAPYSNAAPDFATSNAPKGVPFVVSAHGDAVGYLFGNPLHSGAGHSEHANKILWYVRQPRDNHPLAIQARPRDAAGPVVDTSIAADSGPGEIYPSTVDVPTAGCWRLHLTWGAHQDDIDLKYVPCDSPSVSDQRGSAGAVSQRAPGDPYGHAILIKVLIPLGCSAGPEPSDQEGGSHVP